MMCHMGHMMICMNQAKNCDVIHKTIAWAKNGKIKTQVDSGR